MSQRYIVTISGLDSWTHANCLKINDEQGSNSNARTLTVALQVHTPCKTIKLKYTYRYY